MQPSRVLNLLQIYIEEEKMSNISETVGLIKSTKRLWVKHPRAPLNTKNTSQPWGSVNSCQTDAKHKLNPGLGQESPTN